MNNALGGAFSDKYMAVSPADDVEASGHLDHLTLRKVALYVLFFYAITPFEFHGEDSSSSSYGLVLKCAFIFAFAVTLASKRSYIENKSTIRLLVGIILYFLAINLVSFTDHALLVLFLICAGIVISDFTVGPTRKELADILAVYLVVNLIGLLLDIITQHFYGTSYDFHHLLIPFSASRHTIEYGAARATGFQIEPGDYATWVPLAVMLRNILMRKIYSPLNMICVLSTVLTYSAWAIVGVSGYLLSVAVALVTSNELKFNVSRRAVRVSLWILVILIISAVAAISLSDDVQQYIQWYIDYLEFRYSSNSGSYFLVAIAYQAFMTSLSTMIFVGHSVAEDFCYYCKGTQLGFWAYSIYRFGLIPSAIFVIYWFARVRRSFGIAYVVLLAPIFISRVDYFDPLMWTLIGAVLAEANLASNQDEAMPVDAEASTEVRRLVWRPANAGER